MKKQEIIQDLDLNEIKREAKKKTIWTKLIPFLDAILDIVIDRLLDALLKKYHLTKK